MKSFLTKVIGGDIICPSSVKRYPIPNILIENQYKKKTGFIWIAVPGNSSRNGTVLVNKACHCFGEAFPSE